MTSRKQEIPRYQDGVERSAEFLRLALPLMSRQVAAVHPHSYAVWYEYVSGRNRLLNQQIDALQRPLSEELTFDFYCQFIRTPGEAVTDRTNAALQSAIEDVSTQAKKSEDSTRGYGQHLQQFSNALSALVGNSDVPDSVARMMSHTGEVLLTMSTLAANLAATRQELDVLREELNQKREQAMNDALTGIRNRRGFEESLTAMIAQAAKDGSRISLLLVDIDHFKRFNDNYGHITGDKVLKLVAHILRDCVRGADTVARIGGEEFAVLLASTELAGAKRVGEILRANISRAQVQIGSNSKVDRVTASIGVGSWQSGETPERLMERTDAALYRAKSSGRDRVVLADLNPNCGDEPSTAQIA
jgi:diguanylate cyclase